MWNILYLIYCKINSRLMVLGFCFTITSAANLDRVRCGSPSLAIWIVSQGWLVTQRQPVLPWPSGLPQDSFKYVSFGISGLDNSIKTHSHFKNVDIKTINSVFCLLLKKICGKENQLTFRVRIMIGIINLNV